MSTDSYIFNSMRRVLKIVKGKDGKIKKYLVNIPTVEDVYCPGGQTFGSLDFGGATQYLSVAGSGDSLVLGTGSFTVEWFQYQTSQTSFARVFTQNVWPNAEIGVSIEAADPNANFYLWMDALGNTPATANSASVNWPYTGSWNHFAVVRKSGSYMQIFRNGSALKTITSGPYITASISSSAPWIIGGEGDGVLNTRFSGSITNFRVVKGYDLYSASYTVPTSQLSVVPGTKLLLLGGSSNPVYDATGINTVTQNGVTWNSRSPFNLSTPYPSISLTNNSVGGAQPVYDIAIDWSYNLYSYSPGSFEIQRYRGAGPWTTIATVSTNNVSNLLSPGFNDHITDGTDGEIVFYRVRYVHSLIIGDWSNQMSVTLISA